ncbi:MAG: TolC family protein [Candidatus Sericytochromatia bacterium]
MKSNYLILSLFIINIFNYSYSEEDKVKTTNSLSYLIDSSIKNNKIIQINEKNKLIGESTLIQSSLYTNPNFLIEYGSNWFIDRTDGYNFNFQYSHPFELFGKRNSIYQVSKVQLDNINNDINYQKQLFILDLKSEYINTLIYQENLALTENLFNLSTKILKLSDNKYKFGDISKYDLNNIRIEVSKIETQLINIKNISTNSLERLKFLTGLNDIKINGDKLYLIKDINNADLYIKALNNRFDIKSIEINENLYNSQIKSFEIQAIPNISLIGGFQSQKGDAQTTNTILLGIGSDLAFFNRNQGLILEYQILKEQNNLKLELLKEQIKNQININVNSINNLVKNINIYRNDIIPIFLENLEIVKKAYEIGDKDLIEYINEQNRFINIQKEYIAFLQEYKLSILSLEKNVGISIIN